MYLISFISALKNSFIPLNSKLYIIINKILVILMKIIVIKWEIKDIYRKKIKTIRQKSLNLWYISWAIIHKKYVDGVAWLNNNYSENLSRLIT